MPRSFFLVRLPEAANWATAAILVDLEAWPPVLEYTSVSNTKMLMSSPEANTWSTPPKPISYAQPSPPKIQWERLIKNCFFSRISFSSGVVAPSASIAATKRSERWRVAAPRLANSIHCSKASFNSPVAVSTALEANSTNCWRIFLTPMYIP